MILSEPGDQRVLGYANRCHREPFVPSANVKRLGGSVRTGSIGMGARIWRVEFSLNLILLTHLPFVLEHIFLCYKIWICNKIPKAGYVIQVTILEVEKSNNLIHTTSVRIFRLHHSLVDSLAVRAHDRERVATW